MGNPPITLYDAACRALAECARIDEVKPWKDKATALAAYARQVHNPELEIQAAEIRARARRRMGELSSGLDKVPPEESGAMAHAGLPLAGKTSKATVLQAAGISTSEAQRCEAIASIPEAEIEAHFAECREKGRPVSAEGLLRHKAPPVEPARNDQNHVYRELLRKAVSGAEELRLMLVRATTHSRPENRERLPECDPVDPEDGPVVTDAVAYELEGEIKILLGQIYELGSSLRGGRVVFIQRERTCDALGDSRA
jgi:hypothetical protein